MRWVRVFAAIVLGLCLLGCNAGLARQMVTAPNRRLSEGPHTQPSELKDGRFSVPVGHGDDAAVIAGWVLEPKLQPGQSLKGTIIVLHGFLADHVLVRGAAEVLADAGYRAVLLDLRGHGESTGKHITYGVLESRDMIAVTDYLQKRGLAGDSVGVYGTSLGAAIAIQWAAIDPRVKAVVAVAPFATLKDEAPHFAKTMLPLPGLFLSSNDVAIILARAGQIAHFDPNAANPLDAITRTHASILLIHGDDDAIIPSDHSRRLHAAAPGSELVILPMHGHWAASFDWFGDVSKRGRDFFDKHLAPAPPAAH
jgi:pimeloyl-ACP methyl ester carboxylesterase